MNRLVAAAAVSLALSVGTAAQAAEFVKNGDFTLLTSTGTGNPSAAGGFGQLGYNTNADYWFSAAPNASYNFVFHDANIGSPGQYTDPIHDPPRLWTATNGGDNDWNGLTDDGVGNFIAIDGAFHSGAVTQLISGLTIGRTYHLSFDYAFSQQATFDGDTTQNLTVSLGDFSNTTTNLLLPSHGFSGWNTANFNFVANAESALLSFSSVASPTTPVQYPPFALVSSVSLTSVPEPTTWGMLVLGFAGLGAAARLRRRAAMA